MLPKLTKIVVTPCSGRAWGSLISAPKMFLYSEAAFAKSGVAMATWFNRPKFHNVFGITPELKDLLQRVQLNAISFNSYHLLAAARVKTTQTFLPIVVPILVDAASLLLEA